MAICRTNGRIAYNYFNWPTNYMRTLYENTMKITIFAALAICGTCNLSYGQQPPIAVPPIFLFTGTGQADAEWVSRVKFPAGATWNVRVYREFLGTLTYTDPLGRVSDIPAPSSAVRFADASISTTLLANGSITFNGYSSTFVNEARPDPKPGDNYTGPLPVESSAIWKTIVPGRTEGNAPRFTIYAISGGTQTIHLAYW